MASVREFGNKVIRHVYFLAVGVVGGILAIIDSVSAASAKANTTPFSIPLWVWLPLLAAGFLVAIFLAFHDVRMERDRARSTINSRLQDMRNALRVDGVSCIGRSGVGGTVDADLILTVANDSDEEISYEVEDASTVIAGKSGKQRRSGSRAAVIRPHGTNNFKCPTVRGLPLNWQGDGLVGLTVRYGYVSSPPQYRVQWEYQLSFSRTPGSPTRIDVVATPVRSFNVEKL